MRKLAVLAFSFSVAVFAANYFEDHTLLLPVGLTLLLLCPVCYTGLKRSGRARLAAALVCAGLSAGLIWTVAYSAIMFRPAQALDNQTVVLTGVVEQWPEQTEYGYRVLVQADTASFVKVSTILYVDEQGMDLRPGDRISTVAHCTLGDKTFSGQEITYYTAKGIFLQAKSFGRLDIQPAKYIPPQYWPTALARAFKQGIGVTFPEDTAPLVQALVTGNRDNLTDEFTSSLQRTGLSHVVAVSGMHLAVLAGMVEFTLGKGKRSTAVITILWVFVFCGVAGNTPSVTRAAVMIVMTQLAPLLGRERDSATALGLALMLLLAWNPYSAAHVGLQLSFASVAGILLLSDFVQNWLLTKCRLNTKIKDKRLQMLRVVPRFVVSTTSVTLGAMVMTVGPVALHFGYFSLIAPFSNLLTLWAVSLLLLGGFWIGGLGIVAPGLAGVLAWPFVLLGRYLNWVIAALGKLSLSALPMDSIYNRAWLVFIYVLIGAAAVMRGRKRPILPICAGAVTLAAAMLFTSMSFQFGTMTAAVLDVGQGQSVLLRSGRFLTLVDCGGDGINNAGDVAANYIQALGRNRLDLLVLTHYHADHANGVPQLLRRLNVSAIALPDVEEDSRQREEVLSLARELGIEVLLIQEDTTLQLSTDKKLTLYAPFGAHLDQNEQGLTVLASSKGVDALITGDMGEAVESLLLSQANLPQVELLVVGHHGSNGSTGQQLLQTVSPKLAVISVGQGNRYGHPHQDTLERLDEAGAQIYRTDLQGTVTVRANAGD